MNKREIIGRVLGVLVLLLFAFGAPYLFSAIVQLEADITKWQAMERAGWLACGTIITGFWIWPLIRGK